jgi:hypothetical protein
VNDLDPITELIAELAPSTPLASAQDLAPARRRLMTALATGDPRPAATARLAPGSRTGNRHGSRAGWQVALAGTATAAAAAGIAIAMTLTSAAPTAPAQPPQADQTGRPRVILRADLIAAQFLTSAATATARQRAVIPRPDQFIFTQVKQTSTPQTAPRILRTWMSVNGSRRGLVEPQRAVPAGRWQACTLEQAHKTGCASTAAFLPHLPTDPAKLLAFLRGTVPAGQHMRNWAAYVIGQIIWNLETQEYLLPAQRAAIFHVMTHISGLHLTGRVIDPVGRTGAGIWWRFDGAKTMLIFDPVSYAFLAMVSWPPRGSGFRGTVSQVLVKMAIVSRLPHPGNQVSVPYLAAPSASPSPAGP